jgi:hypothetical protein
MRWRQAPLTEDRGELPPVGIDAPFAERRGWAPTSLTAMIIPFLAASLAACAPAIHPSGNLPGAWAGARGQTFALAEDSASDGGAGAVVVRLLEARGLRRAGDAPYRVDVALSVSDPRISLASDARPPSRLTLCRRRRYALSVSMVDKRDGTVVFRRGAEARRCGELPPRLVERLAIAALGD